jgi:hypothetical protein
VRARARAGKRGVTAGTIASEGVIPLSVFVNFVSCISRHYPPYRTAAQPLAGTKYRIVTTSAGVVTAAAAAVVAAAWSVMLPPIGRINGLSELRNGRRSNRNIFPRALLPASYLPLIPSNIFVAKRDL